VHTPLTFVPPALQKYLELYNHPLRPEGFLGAKKLEWFKTWRKVLDWGRLRKMVCGGSAMPLTLCGVM
jgi:hypothetical protein